MCRVLVYGEDTEIHIAGEIDMKKLAWLSIEDYGTTVMEIIVASAMKGYLRRMSEEEALKKVAHRCQFKAMLMGQSSPRSSMSPWRIRYENWK